MTDVTLAPSAYGMSMSMRLLITGGTGVLGRALRPLAEAAGHQISDPDAWRENDRLRAEASRILVDAAIAAGAAVYVQPGWHPQQ